jgi:hypothetical protein
VDGISQQFVMTCSSDGTLQIFKSDESFAKVAAKSLDTVKIKFIYFENFENLGNK